MFQYKGNMIRPATQFTLLEIENYFCFQFCHVSQLKSAYFISLYLQFTVAPSETFSMELNELFV